MNKYRLWLLVIILIALAVRLHNLTYHSLWFDEAISIHWAKQSVPRILEVGFTLVEDRLPPLYYLMLKGWTELTGFSETGVRSLSVFLGTLLVPATAGVAALLFNRRVALMTAAFVTFNPFLVWYSQEARMYAPVVLFGTLSVWAFLQVCQLTTRNLKPNTRNSNSEPRTPNSQTQNPPLPARGELQTRNPKLQTRLPPAGGSLKPALFILLFILAGVAALYSHLYAGFLLPGLGLWLVISYPRRWKLWLTFAASGLLITLAYAPILLAIWRFSAEAAPGHPLAGIADRAWWLLQAFTVWKAPLSPALGVAIPATTLLFAALAFLPIINYQLSITNYQLPITNAQYPYSKNPHKAGAGGHRKGTPLAMSKSTMNKNSSTPSPSSHPTSHIPYPFLLVTLLLTFPFLIANVLLFRNHLAFFGERYFIIMVPWLLILAAVGADKLGYWLRQQTRKWREPRITHHVSRITYHAPRTTYPSSLLPPPSSLITTPSSLLTLLPFTLLLLLTALPIPGQWSIPAAKEAWRQSVDYLAHQATSADGILIHPDWVRFPFQYYFQGPGQTYAAFSNVTPETRLDGPLEGVVNDHAVIWLVQSHLAGPDPDRRVEQWLAARYPLVTELYPPGVTVKGYAPGYRLDILPPTATPVDIQFENGLRLVGYRTDTVVSAADTLFHPPSGWLHVTLYWTTSRSLTANVTPFIHLVGPEGVWGVNLERPNDALKFYPPARWADGEIIRQDLDVNLNPATPPGTYQLIVSLHGLPEQYPLGPVEVR